jgi:hypothetical protein
MTPDDGVSTIVIFSTSAAGVHGQLLPSVEHSCVRVLSANLCRPARIGANVLDLPKAAVSLWRMGRRWEPTPL